MECQRNKKRRQSLRLKNFDYASSGAYFITLCTQNRECLFGVVDGGEMELNEVGEMISTIWSEIPAYYPSFYLDEFIVMPNHFHAIIWKQEQSVGVGPRGMSCSYNSDALPSSMKVVYPSEAPASNEAAAQAGQPRGVAPTIKGDSTSLFDIVYQFKSVTTNKYIKGVKTKNWKPFNKRVWQRNYYERVIRDDNELNNIRQYILDNPKNWLKDKYYFNGGL